MSLRRRSLILFAELFIMVCAALIWSPNMVAQATDTASPPAPGLQRPTSEPPLVVRGRVVQTESYWNSDHSLIESRSTLVVESSLSGTLTANPAHQVTVYTMGGELPNGMGMLASDAPIADTSRIMQSIQCDCGVRTRAFNETCLRAAMRRSGV